MARRMLVDVPDLLATDALTEEVAQFYADPLGFVEFVFPWGEKGTTLHDQVGPDVWQRKVLCLIGELIEQGAKPDQAAAEGIRIAVASGHGIGKTALVAWIILWFMATRPNPQVIVTANTQGQLSGKTWRELSKWNKLSLIGEWFMWTATKFYFKAEPDTWVAHAVPWTKERAESFAGTHERHVLIIFDEASAIDDAIWDVAEGAMTTEGAMWICFGNPTRNTGRFRECFRKFRHRWKHFNVDSREAKMTNKAQLEAWIEDYGIESDFVKIRILGQFPAQGERQFIAEDTVEAAFARHKAALRLKRQKLGERNSDDPVVLDFDDAEIADETQPIILAVDPARSISGDDSKVWARRGRLAKCLATYRGLDGPALAQKVALHIMELQPDATFIDEAGVGASAYDHLRFLGYEVEGCLSQVKALDDRRYINRRIEMWDSMHSWLKKGGMLEESNDVKDDLTGPEIFFDGKGRFQLEKKDDMKARGLPSPDDADALALTFWMPVAPRRKRQESLRKFLAGQDFGGTSHMSH